jgi:RimJ/RimL family protein N-acetyltransferase
LSEIAAGKVYLRPLCGDDLDRLLGWHNDPELYATLAGHFRPVAREVEQEWLQRRMAAADELNLAICLSDSAEHVGNIYLRDINRQNLNAELHIFIARPEHRGHGYGGLAVRLITKYAFEELGLARLYLHVLASNFSAIKTYEACGFAKEGTLRGHVFKNGVFEDLVIMGLRNERRSG